MLSRNPFVLCSSMVSGWRLQTPFTDNGNYLFDWIRISAGDSSSRKKNDRPPRRKETRFKFLMVNCGGGNDGKRERVGLWEEKKRCA